MQNSYQWIDAVMVKLFAAEDRRIDAMVTELNRQNSEIKKKPLFGFIHLGERYIPESCKMQAAAALRRQPMPTLAFELLPQASNFTNDIAKLKQDKDQIKQVLFKQLYQANNLQEVRDSLPDCVAALVPEIAKLNRFIEDPTWLNRNDWRAIRDYERALPKIEMYAMSRLIY